MNAIVRDVMTTRVAAVLKTATFKEMATLLREHRVSAFPVVDSDAKVVGVVSDGAGGVAVSSCPPRLTAQSTSTRTTRTGRPTTTNLRRQ